MSARAFSVVAAAFVTGIAAPAQADDFPTRPITIVVPFGAGSGSDVTARFYARALKETLNANAVVEIKPGAAGMIGGQAVARAVPDGHTVLMGSGTVNAANYPLFRDRIPYGPKDFAVVSTTHVSPPLLFAAKDLPGDTIAELVANAKRAGRVLNCGNGNAVTQVACEMLRRKTGADVASVPYRGNSQAMADLAAGQIAIAFSDMSAAGPFVSSGAARPVATPTAQRQALLPTVRTFEEQGISDFEFMSWTAIFVPAGTPVDRIRKLNDAARHMLAMPEWEKHRIATGGMKLSGDRVESEAFVRDELARWERYVKETGVKGTQ